MLRYFLRIAQRIACRLLWLSVGNKPWEQDHRWRYFDFMIFGKMTSSRHPQPTWGAELLMDTSKLFHTTTFVHVSVQGPRIRDGCSASTVDAVSDNEITLSQVNKPSPKYTLRTFKLCWRITVGQTPQVQTVWTLHYHLHVPTALALYLSCII